MSTSPEGRRLKGFRLADVPLRVRQDAYDRLLKTNGSADGTLVRSDSPAEFLALGLAAEDPSDRVYWVSSEAWERVMRSRRAR